VGLVVEYYQPSAKAEWDEFVRASKNGTFLFCRDYMDYHSHRFHDCSLLVRNNVEIVAVLPANRTGQEAQSHAGLTYGGLVTSVKMTTPFMLDVFGAVLAFLREAGIERLIYKTIPAIYHRIPAEEDRYALFRAEAILYRRDILSVVRSGGILTPQTRRRRGARRAKQHGVAIGRSEDWAGYWSLLSANLSERFGVAPVHSVAEIDLLRRRFVDNISLHTAVLDGEVLAGVTMFETDTVAHAQYIATSERGRTEGALDLLLLHLLQDTFVAKPFFDFGTSTEQEGLVLNRGLIDYKEGFGARAVAHDIYRLIL
jgi:hypothetical protein